MQTSHDAVNAVLRKGSPEFVPLHDYPWEDTLKKWQSQGMTTQDGGTNVDAVDHFGFDMAGCGGWFEWHPKRGVQDVLEETDAWKTVRNGSGAILKWWKDKSGTPEHIDFEMTSRQVWEDEYKPHLLNFDPDRVDVKGAVANLERRRADDKWTFFGHQFIWECMRASMGDVVMYMALLEDPDWIHDFNRTYTDMWKQAFTLLLQNAGKPDGVWIYEDLGYRDRLFCSPELLRELIFPYYKELVAFLHHWDLPVILHSCGFQAPMIPLAIEAGFDAINPMEVKAGNDILQYAEQFGDELAFVGGFDARIIESGDHEQMRAEVRKFMRGMKERQARFVFGSDHSLSTEIDYADYCQLLATYREESEY